MVKNPPANAGDVGSIPGSGRSPGVGNGNPLQYSCLKNPMGRGAWQTTVLGVAKSWTQLRDYTMTTEFRCVRGSCSLGHLSCCTRRSLGQKPCNGQVRSHLRPHPDMSRHTHTQTHTLVPRHTHPNLYTESHTLWSIERPQ